MNILLYKPLYYDLNKIAKDINVISDEGAIKDSINSFFSERAPSCFRRIYTLKRGFGVYDNYPSIYWTPSSPRREAFKELKVVSVY